MATGTFWGVFWVIFSIALGALIPVFNPNVSHVTSVMLSGGVGFVVARGIVLGLAHIPPPAGSRAVIGAISGGMQGAATGLLVGLRAVPTPFVERAPWVIVLAIAGASGTAAIAALFWGGRRWIICVGPNCRRHKKWRSTEELVDASALPVHEQIERLVMDPGLDRVFICNSCQASFCEGCYLRLNRMCGKCGLQDFNAVLLRGA